MLKKEGSLTIEALAQAASNTLLAHIVSLAFLVVLTRKITQAYQKVSNLSKIMPRFVSLRGRGWRV